MKKQIISFIIGAFAIFPLNTPFANAAKFSNIVDSSQIDSTKINTLSSIVDESGTVPIGTIIIWPNSAPPADLNCDSLTGGNGNYGVCKWLVCNGQEVNPDVYPEFIAKTNMTRVPKIGSNLSSNRRLYHRGDNDKATIYGGSGSTPVPDEGYDTYNYSVINRSLEISLAYEVLTSFSANDDAHYDGVRSIGNSSSDKSPSMYGSDYSAYYHPLNGHGTTVNPSSYGKELTSAGYKSINKFQYIIRVSN